jgi:riboflavin transporter FmnP
MVTVSLSSDYLRGRRSVVIAGTAVLSSAVAVLELTRYLRIPFPLFPTLKFDVMGIPMVLAYFLFGLVPGISTSLVSFAIIASRDPFSGAMKALAESATILGAFLVLRGTNPSTSYLRKVMAVFSSIALRVVVMSVANVLFLPVYMGRYYANAEAVIAVLYLIAAFNAAQGAISIVGSFFIYEAIARRIPSLRH